MDDGLLIERYKVGDMEAFASLARKYEGQLYRQALRMLGNHDDAQDAVQEVLVRLMRALPSYEAKAKFSTWLFQVTANTCVDLLRRRQHRVTTVALDPDLPISDENSDPDNKCEKGFREHLLNQALGLLPESQRLLLELRDRQELSNDQVADMLGIDVGTLKSRLHRARQALRRTLEAGVVVKGHEDAGSYQVTPSGALI